MLSHGCDAGMSIAVVHDVSGSAALTSHVSSCWMLEALCGCQMMLACSEMGRTSVV